MKKSFYDTLEWQRIRDEAISFHCECEECGSTKNLTVHHKTYERFGGNELMEDLKILCRECHMLLHDTEEQYWVGIVNRIENLEYDLNSSEQDWVRLLEPKPKEVIEKDISKLSRTLLERKVVQGMDFIVIHNCHLCINSEKMEDSKYKCKRPGKYGCIPGDI